MNQQMIDWGLSTYQATASSLLVPGGGGLFAETASLNGTQSGGDSGFSYVWSAATQMRVYDALVRVDPATYTPILRQFSDQLQNRYWTNAGLGGYRSGISSGATQFYDDNAHLAVALASAYQITGDPTYLTRAENTYNFVLSGENDSAASGGGGIYFNTDRAFKDSAATLQGTRAALLLYQITGQSHYLTDATRLYTWEKNTLQTSDGLFEEKYYTTGPQAGTISTTTLVNFTAFGIDDNVQFYNATGDASYLQEAQRIATRSLTRFFNPTTGAINDEGYWSFELVNALDDLYAADHNPQWLQSTETALDWLHANGQDPNGHYGTLWGRAGTVTADYSSWNLNDQAAVAEAYLYTGLAPEPSGVALFACAAPLVLMRRNRRGIRGGPETNRF
jgi:uncharacterized protein YyaL (SSP411 family)